MVRYHLLIIANNLPCYLGSASWKSILVFQYKSVMVTSSGEKMAVRLLYLSNEISHTGKAIIEAPVWNFMSTFQGYNLIDIFILSLV